MMREYTREKPYNKSMQKNKKWPVLPKGSALQIIRLLWPSAFQTQLETSQPDICIRQADIPLCKP
jgi:hypothetical protein